MPVLAGPQTFRLPRLEDIFSVFPDKGLNHNYTTCCVESRAWISKYKQSVCGPKMCAFMVRCNFELCIAFAYPYAEPTGLRATMDLANILWLYDEYTDTETGERASQAAIIVSNTLKDASYDDGTWICHMMRDFYLNHILKLGENVAGRIIHNFCKTMETIGIEAELREKHRVLDIPAYVAFRREISGIRICFDLVEYCLGLNLPDYVHEDPIFASGYNAAMDLVFWANDLFSYNMEQAKGHSGANIVTVIMKSKKVDLQTAVDFIGDFCEALTFRLLHAKRALIVRADPVFFRDAVRCLEAYEDWVRGSTAWSFATERYFGSENISVKESRIVELRTPFKDSIDLNE